jgi:hypothetical protein
MDLDSAGLSEILGLCDKALGSGLSGGERGRWRAISKDLLEVLKNISPSGSERRSARGSQTPRVHLW